MDRVALLDRLGLTGEELQDLLRKFHDFERGLNQAQLKVLVRSLPSLERARASLGPTNEDLTKLFGQEPDLDGMTLGCFLGEGDDDGSN